MSFDLNSLVASLKGMVDADVLSQGLAFIQVVFIDIVMAGDNAVAVGIAAAGLAPDKRRKAILYGLIGAVVIRIGFVVITVELLKIVGLLLAGGLLLLWVTWKMWHELRDHHAAEAAAAAHTKAHDAAVAAGRAPPEPIASPKTKSKTLFSAVLQILAADISMSLDNVLAVAGAAQNHVWVMAFGLIFAIAAMGLAANLIATMLHKFAWIGYVGVAVVLFIALRMMYEGSMELWHAGHCDMTLKCVPKAAHDGLEWLKAMKAQYLPA